MSALRPVIAGFARSPFHPAKKGGLTKVRPDDLAAAVVAALVAKSGVEPADIEDLILGCAFPEGEQGMNMARTVARLAGLPVTVGGVTVNRYCGSSMQAIHQAAGAILMGAGDVFIAAGVEHMTRVPIPGFNPMPNPALRERDPGSLMSMGQTAENLARAYQITRAAQEAFAVESHRKAAAAEDAGHFADEIVPIETKTGTVDRDGGIRRDTTAAGLADLAPAFDAEGTVTAGTSSPLTDGCAAVIVTHEAYARAHGLTILAGIRAAAITGCDPALMGIGPVGATRKALARAGMALSDIEVIESNEAFSVQSLAVARELGLDLDRANLDGGALALGHPLGATGARITGKAASLMVRTGKGTALATQCIGGGQGIATVLEAVS